MKKTTLLILMLLTFSLGFGQILTFDFVGNTGDEVSVISNYNDPALTASTITRGSGLQASASARLNSFTARNWSTSDIADAVTGNDYFEFTITPNGAYEFSVTDMTFNINRNTNGFETVALRSSLDGYTTNIDGEKALDTGANGLQITTFAVNQTNNSTAVTYRLYGTAINNNGEGRLRGSGNDIIVSGEIIDPIANCVVSDNFTGASIGAEWTQDRAISSSIVSNELLFTTEAGRNIDYIHQDVSLSYNTFLSSLSNPITWEFNMQQSSSNPQGFNNNQKAVAFVIGATGSDLTDGSGSNGYAVILGNSGDPDLVQLVEFEDGLHNSNLTSIIVGNPLGDIKTEHLSIRVTYDPITDGWELFARNDGSSFSSPVSLGAAHSQGTAINFAYTNVSLNYVAAVWKQHVDQKGQTAKFDNLCISTSFDCSLSVVTWTAGAWSPFAPSINTPVIIDDDYTTGGINGSFEACNITINTGNTLTIGDGYVLEVENDITNNGDILIEPQGAIIQNSNIAGTIGNVEVIKETAKIEAWYEYTYWSSPVSGETINGLMDGSGSGRRYTFLGQNYLDATMETNNNNATDPGQDDIDDDGDDWQQLSGSTVMQPGIGYATTLSEAAYDAGTDIGAGGEKFFRFSFIGPLNNGVYSVPIYRNDSETNDNNWNLIGNPYPSAIDADLFLAANTAIETNTEPFPRPSVGGAIYLWSQNTPPDALANGNDAENFSDSDYAIINASGATAGGDGLAPSRFIPSGQAFLVTYSDAATPEATVGDISQGTVTFDNSMRATGATDNGQFFKGSSSKQDSEANKLWINLTNDAGSFNQTAIAYVEDATDDFDGAYYDAIRPAAIVTAAILYSNIEGSDKRIAIQGKDLNSINADEVISLGFKTNTGESTTLTLAIDHLEGEFLTGNDVYLKDNLLNIIHNLKESEYTFTSEVGEFKERFEIVFQNQALSTTEDVLQNSILQIVQLNEDQVKFTISNNLNIKTVTIFDLLGRPLYNLKGDSSTETYSLSNLSSATYVVKVQLSNGAVVTKKMIKK